MRKENRYEVVAYPQGRREVVGVTYAARAEEVVGHACRQAKVRGEFVDVFGPRVPHGPVERIAVVGEDGPLGEEW
jgi:hypothetical protein